MWRSPTLRCYQSNCGYLGSATRLPEIFKISVENGTDVATVGAFVQRSCVAVEYCAAPKRQRRDLLLVATRLWRPVYFTT